MKVDSFKAGTGKCELGQRGGGVPIDLCPLAANACSRP